MAEFVGTTQNRSISDNGSYIVAVKEAILNSDSFASFKLDPRYTEILEHASAAQGAECLEIIKLDSPELISRIQEFAENDLVGGATTHNYSQVGQISPSTLRYVKVASDLKKLFGQDINGNIAEIGVGYGGQMLIADKIFRFDEYHLFDLPPVLELAKKYLECHLLNNSYRAFTLNMHNGKKEYELVLSNYAFSELPSKLQIRYIEKIISKSKRGYLTMNSGLPSSVFQHDKLSLVELEKLLPRFDIIAEKPLTHPGNYIIYWENH